jgi:hypothetical protein
MQRVLQVGAAIGVIALIFLGWWAFHTPSDGPKVTAAKVELFKATDGRQASTIRDEAGPQEVRCDAGTPNLRLFDSLDKTPRLWYSKGVHEGDRIRCWDRDGFDPYNGHRLMPLIGDGAPIDEIFSQAPLPQYLPRKVEATPPPARTQTPPPSQTVATVSNDCGPGGCTKEWGPVTRQIDSWPQGR